MDYETFISLVQENIPLSRQDTERVACVTLQTLERRLSAGEAQDIAKLLPEPLRSCMTPERSRANFHLNGFLRRVVEETGVDRVVAERAARAVFNTLAGAYSYREFLDRVAAEAGIDPNRARWAAEAVLEVLGIRITAGQAEDLVPYVPYELRPALTRGIVEGGTDAVRLPLEEFIQKVAQQEGVSRDDAIVHTRAVFSVLRETVGRKEFDDTTAQLGDDYRLLLKQPASAQQTEDRP